MYIDLPYIKIYQFTKNLGGGKEQVFFLQGTHIPIGAMNTKTNYSSVIIVTSSRIICGAQKGNDVK